ncbi:hypothetical protein ACFLU4_06155 [Chloroflexota bacterium]
MAKTGTKRHILARIVAVGAVVSVILAAISRLTGQPLVLGAIGYSTLATIALLFAIYLMVDRWADAAKKDK